MTSVSWPRTESDMGPESPALDLLTNQAFSEREGRTRAAFRGVSPTGHKESCEETKGPTGPHEALSRG